MTPIQEARSEEGMTTIGSSPSPMPVQSNSNDQQAPTGPSRSVPKRTPSDELQRASPSPAPSMSGQPLPQFLRAHQRAPSPSPSLYENLTNASPIVKPKAGPSRLLPFEPVSPPTYPRHLHQRSASVASVISVSREHHDDDIYGDPVLPKAPIRRGLSDDGDAASLNLTPDTLSSVPPRNGSPRPQVGRLGENYGALFPASVRGAGYRGIPNG
ncbi:hypothetical protein M413DRAFT_344383 [Hebeloma cylindrosporum]|uniref:Uncharacterized protein n=1 Tax=Hebeloma cylindrosporum TaxID=76867 RepID=A0A0C2Y711_HEBCY|nr:hypothetical protein M413DRAFT_344383 [Hebeloma cylindrosporum h7]